MNAIKLKNMFSTSVTSVLFLFLMLGLVTPLVALLGESEENLLYPSVRIKTMGGAYTALADDDNALFYNPAGLAMITDSFANPKLMDTWHLNIAEVGFRGVPGDLIGLGYNLKDILDELKKDDASSDITKILNVAEKYINEIDSLLNTTLGVGFNGPFNLGFTGRIGKIHLGVKIFSYGDLILRTQQIGATPSAEIYGIASKGVIIGGAHTIKIKDRFNLQLGASIKIFNRILYPIPYLYVSEIVTKDEFYQRNPYYSGNGFGMDVGGIFHLTKKIRLSMTINDLLGSLIHYDERRIDAPLDNPDTKDKNERIDYVRKELTNAALSLKGGSDYERAIRPTVNLGFAYLIPVLGPIPKKFISDLYLLTDLRDVIVTGGRTNFFTRVHIGSEISFLGGVLRRWIGTPIKMRFGISQGYFSAGVGMTLLYVMGIDFGYWVDEYGYAPGQRANQNVGLTVRFVL